MFCVWKTLFTFPDSFRYFRKFLIIYLIFRMGFIYENRFEIFVSPDFIGFIRGGGGFQKTSFSACVKIVTH